MPSTTPPCEPAGGPPPGGSRSGAPHPAGAGPRRRSLLAGTAGVLVAGGAAAGCTGEGESPAERRHRIETTRRLRREAARDSEALLSRYTGTALAHPALGGRLAPLREAVARHVEAFGGERTGTGDTSGPDAGTGRDRDPGPPPDGSGPSAPGQPPGGGPAARGHMAVPRDEKRALAALAEAERRTADVRMRALADAPPELARLLASVAAAGSTHAFLLTEEST